MSDAITLVGAVRGLRAEGGRVVSIFNRLKPDVLGLSLSKEALESLGNLQGADGADSGAVNVEEDAYIRGLSAFGEVIKPPPCFCMAWEAASSSGIPVEPLDMDEEHYTMAYCKHVGTLDMIRQGRSQKLLDGYEFRAKSPAEFVIEWDNLVNRLKGYRSLEEAREAWIAKGACRLADSYSRPAIVIELERLDGVKAGIEGKGYALSVVE